MKLNSIKGNTDVSSSWVPTVVSSSGVDTASCVQYTTAPPTSVDLIDASGAAAAAFLSPQEGDAAFHVGDVNWTDAALASLVDSDAATPGVVGAAGCRKTKGLKMEEPQGKSPPGGAGGGKNGTAPVAPQAAAKTTPKNGANRTSPAKKSKTKSKKVRFFP